MRSHEIINIKRSKILILPDHMSIFCVVFIARSDKKSCPVSVTEKLLAKLPVHPDQHLVCRLSSSGSPSLSAIAYSRVRAIFRATLSLFVEDCHNFEKRRSFRC